MTTNSVDILIVGAGHAGAQVAIALRQHGFEGSVLIVGEEPELPYERPPLSKDYFAGKKPFDNMLIRSAAFWAERGVTILTGERVVEVDAVGHRVFTVAGQAIGYQSLVWAAGGTPRRLQCAGNELEGVHALRSRGDVDRIVLGLQRCQHAVIVGGGYIGLEAAAVLRQMGKRVTLLEAQDRVLARVAGEFVSRFYESEHRGNGVDIRLGAAVECFDGVDGRLSGVRLSSGELIPTELAIIGIGIVPSVDPLVAAGAEGSNGVEVDDSGKTSLTDVYAVGDCALDAQPFAEGIRMRLESVQNANDMGARVAKAIVGHPLPARTAPWFWSVQYSLRLQTIGLSIGHDQVVIRGATQSSSFAAIYLKEGRVQALDCVNAPIDFAHGKSLVAARKVVAAEALANASVPLKSWLS